MLIRAFNPSTDDLEKTYLDSAASAGVTSLTVKNTDRFAINDRILIGELGGELSEVVTVSATASTSLTVGATSFAHSQDTPVYQLRFDQVKFYRSTDSGSTYNVLVTKDLDVDNADLQTIYDDTAGTSSYLYKISFYNSISAVESQLSDPIQGTGYRRDQVGYILDKVLKEVNDKVEQFVTKDELIGYMNDVNDDLTTAVSRPYDFLHTRTTLTRTAARNYIDFPTDSNGRQTMWKFDRMDYNFTDSTTTPATDITYTLLVIPPEEFRNRHSDNTIDSTTEDDKTQEMALDTSVNRFRFWPPFETTAAGVFYLYYWKFFTELNSPGDSIETPTPLIYELYLKAMYFKKRAMTELTYEFLAQNYEQQYGAEKQRYAMHNRKDKGTPRFFKLPTPTTKNYRRGF